MTNRKRGKKQLLSEMDAAWAALNSTLAKFSDRQMTVIRDAEGWSVKDHLSHLAGWERSVIFYLENKPRNLALGINASLFDKGPIDEINRELFEANRNVPLPEVLAQYRAVHHELMRLLAPLVEEDLLRPSGLLQAGNLENAKDPYDLIHDNTAGHIEEHLEWMETLVQTSSE
jgi:hypothetical protein